MAALLDKQSGQIAALEVSSARGEIAEQLLLASNARKEEKSSEAFVCDWRAAHGGLYGSASGAFQPKGAKAGRKAFCEAIVFRLIL